MICHFCGSFGEKHESGWVVYSMELTACGRKFFVQLDCCEDCDDQHKAGINDEILMVDSFQVYDLV